MAAIITDFGVMVDVSSELGRGCASTSWVYINLIAHNWMLPLWPPQAMDDIWGENPHALIGSTLIFPAGKLEPVSGGYNYSGRWPYASGIDVSDWMMLGAMLADPDDKPSSRIVVVRAADLDVIDTWHVSGLAGTGSKDVTCEQLFVPDHMVFDPAVVREGYAPGTEEIDGDAYRLPVIPFIPHLVAGPMIGIARGAYEDFIEKLQSQTSIHNRSRLAEHTTIQLKIAEAGVLIDIARLLVRESWQEAHRYVAHRDRPSVEDRARWRRDAAYAAGCCVRAVDLIHRVSGATANYLDNMLQLRHRDVHAAAPPKSTCLGTSTARSSGASLPDCCPPIRSFERSSSDRLGRVAGGQRDRLCVSRDGAEVGGFAIRVGHHCAAGKRYSQRIVGEWVGRDVINALAGRAHRDGDVLARVARNVLKRLLDARALMRAIEIKRQRVEELELFVVLEEMAFLDPGGGLWITGKLRFQLLLPCQLTVEHVVCRRPVFHRQRVQENVIR